MLAFSEGTADGDGIDSARMMVSIRGCRWGHAGSMVSVTGMCPDSSCASSHARILDLTVCGA